MKRNLKAMGLALVAAFALSAVAASAASADFTTTSDGTTNLTAKALTSQVFTTGAEEVKCANVAANGSVEGTTQESVTAVPVYTNCSVSNEAGTFTAFIDVNGCTYEFTTDTEVHICQSGGPIVVTAEIVPPFKSKCLEIGKQTPTNPEVHYTNEGSGGADMHVIVESTVEGITYKKVGPCGSTEGSNASYTGEVTISGHDSVTGDPVGVTKHDV